MLQCSLTLVTCSSDQTQNRFHPWIKHVLHDVCSLFVRLNNFHICVLYNNVQYTLLFVILFVSWLVFSIFRRTYRSQFIHSVLWSNMLWQGLNSSLSLFLPCIDVCVFPSASLSNHSFATTLINDNILVYTYGYIVAFDHISHSKWKCAWLTFSEESKR